MRNIEESIKNAAIYGLGIATFIGTCYFSYKLSDGVTFEYGNGEKKPERSNRDEDNYDKRGKTIRVMTALPKTLFQKTVSSLYLGQRYMNNDYYKFSAADKIYCRAKSARDLTEDDKVYVLDTLTCISTEIKNNYYQNSIMDYIDMLSNRFSKEEDKDS